MKGWGRASVLVGLGLALALGCGGRTSALGGDYVGEGNTSSGANAGAPSLGGASAIAGQANRGGTASRAGAANRGGTTSIGGGYTGGATSVGGYPSTGGAYGGGDIGGYPVGGYTYGGYAGDIAIGGYGFGGTFTTGGFATGGFGGGGSDCLSCVRQSCTPQLAQCFQDFGCLSIFACMQDNNCQAYQCYSDRTCKKVIDQWGGPAGQSMNELLTAFTCAFEAGCACN